MKVIVVGGGPSGMMAAINASLYHDVILLERNASLGRKLLLTGNRRCNITNNKESHDMIKLLHNGKFMYSTFAQYDVNSIKQFFFDNHLPLIEETDNRMYPHTQRAVDILKVMESKLNHVDVRFNSLVSDIIIENNTVVGVKVNDKIIECDYLIMATGGLSFPTLGSDGIGHNILKTHNIELTDNYPVEASLISKDKLIRSLDLVGLSFKDVEVKVLNSKKKVIYKTVDDILFTHKGLSGPAALSCAEYIYKQTQRKEKAEVYINFLPHITQHDFDLEIHQDSSKRIDDFLNQYFYKRFTEYLLKELSLDASLKITSISNKNLENLYSLIFRKKISINNVDSIKRAFVTGGGVNLKHIDSKTYKHKLIHNLSICGELLDLHGPIGGYNLTIAILSGWSAGINI